LLLPFRDPWLLHRRVGGWDCSCGRQLQAAARCCPRGVRLWLPLDVLLTIATNLIQNIKY
jgi:hypothetical protein